MYRSVRRQRSHRSFPILLAIACLAAGAHAQAPAPNEAQARMEALNRQADNTGTGRFPAMKEEIAALPAHVVYRPRDLDALGSQKLGVVAWGNGGCSDDGASSRFHLLELASHGYLVLANGRIFSGPGAAARQAPAPAEPGQLPPPRTSAADLVTAIDWALQENARPGSPYFERIDPAQIAFSGFSCGGLQAMEVAADPRVKTLVLHNTGIFNDGPSAIPGMALVKEDLNNIHTPVIYILGGETDIAYANGMDDFRRIEHVPVAAANLPVGHGGTFMEPDGGSAARIAVHWLQWQLRGDAEAARTFVGDDCGLCRDAEWSFERKRIGE